MTEETLFQCPMCGTDFVGTDCHGACPFAGGCAMVRCPRCGYEFVGGGKITQLLTAIFRRRHP